MIPEETLPSTPATPATQPSMPLPALSEGRFTGPAEFTGMVRTAFAHAAREGWPEIIMADADFTAWPLGERAVVQSLHDWAKPGRKLTMLANNYNGVVRRHARFVNWRGTWSHIVECRAIGSLPPTDFPSSFWSPAWCFQQLDLDHLAGVAGAEPARLVGLKERLREYLLKSAPAFPATTLGL